MDHYGQEAEVRLLGRIAALLGRAPAVDVGAEQGAFVGGLLDAGVTEVHAFEPEPANIAALERRFGGDERVTVHGIAVSDANRDLVLQLSAGTDGTPLSYGHTVLQRPPTEEIHWSGSITVSARSLGSLVETGELPAHVGILKIDTEGHDFAVVAGMGALECDVVMAEHWVDLPRSLGPCPWSFTDLAALMSRRGLNHFAFVSHRDALTLVQWDDAAVPAGSMGNVLFVHDRVLQLVMPAIVESASELALAAVEAAETRGRVAAERLAVIEELKAELAIQSRAAAERLAAMERQHRSTR